MLYFRFQTVILRHKLVFIVYEHTYATAKNMEYVSRLYFEMFTLIATKAIVDLAEIWGTFLIVQFLKGLLKTNNG